MRPAGFDRKVGPADADHAFGVGGPQVGDLAISDHPRKRIGVVPGQLGGLGQGEELFALVSEGSLDLQRRPLERAGLGLSAEGLSEFLGLGEDVGDCLVDGAAIRTQKDTPPKESQTLRGVLRVGNYARAGQRKSRPVRSRQA